VPKALAERYHIEPGDEIEWEAAGDVIRVVPRREKPARDLITRLKFFDQATARQRTREHARPLAVTTDRDWTREELYERGRAR